MREDRLRLIYSAYAWGMGLLVLALGVGFGLSCLAIYRNGGGVGAFTRESIGRYWARLMPLTCACLLGILGGWVLSLIMAWRGEAVDGTGRSAAGRVRAVKPPSARLKRRAERLRLEAVPAHLRRGMLRERALRRWLARGTAVICTALLIPGLVWCADSARFSVEQLNRDIAAASRVILAGTAVALATAAVSVLLREASAVRELALIREAVAESRAEAFSPAVLHTARKPVWTQKPGSVWCVRAILAVTALILLELGIWNGGMADVLGKAVRICTECIGLG